MQTKKSPLKFIVSSAGFSLVELTIASLLSASFLLLAIGFQLDVMKGAKAAEIKSSMSTDAFRILDYFTQQIQTIGGGSITTWASFVLDNSDAMTSCPNLPAGLVACQGTDRLTLVHAEITPSQGEFKIESVVSASNQYNILKVDQGSGPVCLLPNLADLTHRSVVLTQGRSYLHRYIEQVDNSGSNCFVILVPLRLQGRDYLPSTNYVGGTMTVADFKTFFVDPSLGLLFYFRNRDNANVVTSDQIILLARGIYDLQVALSFTAGFGPGFTTDNGVNDSWIFEGQSSADTVLSLVQYETLWKDTIRFFKLSLVTGRPAFGDDRTANFSAKALDGPLRELSGVYLRAFQITILPRNQYL